MLESMFHCKTKCFNLMEKTIVFAKINMKTSHKINVKCINDCFHLTSNQQVDVALWFFLTYFYGLSLSNIQIFFTVHLHCEVEGETEKCGMFLFMEPK